MSNVCLESDDFTGDLKRSNCEAVKTRYRKVHNLLESQAKTILDLQETHSNINEKTTRLIQKDVQQICSTFEDLTTNSVTGRVYRQHALYYNIPMLDDSLAKIKNACEFANRPLPRDNSPEEYTTQRINYAMIQEAITNLAHKNQALEHIMVDRDNNGHNMTVASWQPKGFKTIHYFYEALLSKDANHAMDLVKINRQAMESTPC
ncbi:Uncharacterised protein [uncultured archaeon]|nr:Uncharacterised protein [uncultured archaeon]